MAVVREQEEMLVKFAISNCYLIGTGEEEVTGRILTNGDTMVLLHLQYQPTGSVELGVRLRFQPKYEDSVRMQTWLLVFKVGRRSSTSVAIVQSKAIKSLRRRTIQML